MGKGAAAPVLLLVLADKILAVLATLGRLSYSGKGAGNAGAEGNVGAEGTEVGEKVGWKWWW